MTVCRRNAIFHDNRKRFAIQPRPETARGFALRGIVKQSGGWRGERGSRHERGYGSHWDKLRLAALSRDMHLCQPCKREGRVTPATEVDHIVPKSKGGADDLEQLQSICGPCHAYKTAEEAAQAQGRRVKPRIGEDGWPIG